jgi:glucosamine 6-phosphate synthetase-like amidotransferase/phosphosugar isomerase protein
MAICTAEGVELRDLAAQPISAKVETIKVDMQAIQKQGYDHFPRRKLMSSQLHFVQL